ncbi:MAG: HAD family hydrolase [Schwartzia sp.]|nr:HAD family hydrolase [Schwartzia sp. (in: firmicutes)]
MKNPVYTKALIRFLISLPLLAALFGCSALPSLYMWSRLYAPNWSNTFDMLAQNAGFVECCAALLLMCAQYPIYRRAFDQLRRRRPASEALIAVSSLSAFILGVLPLFFNWTAGIFSESPLYASAMSALLAFSAMGEEFPSYFQLIGLWTFFFGVGDLLRARAAVLLAHAVSAAPIPENDISLPLSPISGYAVFLSLAVVILTGLAWSLLGVSLPFIAAFCLFLALSAAPCALPLAEAVPLWIGAALLDEHGVSLKSLRAVEAAASADMLVLNKADVLTRGEPQITDIFPEGITLSALMSLAAAAESGSRHPIAKVISEHAIRLRAKYGRIAAFNESPGEGVEVLMNSAPIRVGRKEWIESQGVRISANLLTKDDQLAEKGKTILYVSNGKNAKGIIAYEYELEEDTLETVQALATQGVGTILMIGEGPRTAKALAKELGVPDFRHSIRTADLVREIQLLQAHGKNVALFANLPEDSPAMKQADCPIFPFLNESDDNAYLKEPPASKQIIDSEIDVHDSEGEKNAVPVPGSPLLPALAVKGLPDLPPARALLQRLLVVIRQNTLAAFLGPLLIFPASSGILATAGNMLPAPWLTALAALPGLCAVIVNAVRMGRELAAIQTTKKIPDKEEAA